jgi:hypothetical protein
VPQDTTGADYREGVAGGAGFGTNSKVLSSKQLSSGDGPGSVGDAGAVESTCRKNVVVSSKELLSI